MKKQHTAKITLLVTLFISFMATAITTVLGVAVGMWWGFSKKVDTVMIEVYNVISNVPFLLLAMILSYVLGAGLEDDGTPSEALALRLDAAAAYLGENPGSRCVVSGGQQADEVRSEADAMADYLAGEKGVDPTRVIKEAASTSTVENLQNSRALVPEDASVAVVTNDFHMHRALAIARKQGFPQAWGLAAPSNPLYLAQAGLRETHHKEWLE